VARRTRIYQPPPTRDIGLNRYLQDLTAEFNLLPGFSIISTSDGPESNTTGEIGDVAIDVGSAVTRLWIKNSGTTTVGWLGYLGQ